MKVLNLSTINQNILKTKYAVRGELAIKADQLSRELEDGKELPFKKITYCNIGNPQQLGQPPITFFRQVCALLELQSIGSASSLALNFPRDVQERVQKITNSCPSIGAYSSSNGLVLVRESVARFIQKRDGFPADPNQIYLTNGASEGIARVLNAIIAHSRVGVMIPIPQYPLYTATLAMLDGRPVEYFLDEERGWALDMADLHRAIAKARADGIEVRAIVLINPGNPTGQVLTRDNLTEIIKFCQRERIIILADEVYQENIYCPETNPFLSVKRVLMEMGPEFSESVELISFHSTSKGLIGECGRRGGYFECHGLDRTVQDELFKVASVSLCSNVLGQVMVSLMVEPPTEGDPSYPQYQEERTTIYNSLKRRAAMLHELFNSLPGVTCQPATGALYLFPSFTFPEKAFEAAKLANKDIDTYYALELLNATGVCMVPGSGFGQREGSHHLRTTFLPPEEEFPQFLNLIHDFHISFLKRHQ